MVDVQAVTERLEALKASWLNWITMLNTLLVN